MRKIQLGLVTVFSAVVGSAVGVLVNGAPVQARQGETCPNVYCKKGGSECLELTQWWCQLDGGCSGFGKCAPIEAE
jgi:hypothetical protein